MNFLWGGGEIKLIFWDCFKGTLPVNACVEKCALCEFAESWVMWKLNAGIIKNRTNKASSVDSLEVVHQITDLMYNFVYFLTILR